MSIEVGVLISKSMDVIHWHLPTGRSVGELPDSRELWDVMWKNRFRLLGFAHSHPGIATPRPSTTDITTFAAIEAGLGVRLNWWILSWKGFCLVRHVSDQHRSWYETVESYMEDDSGDDNVMVRRPGYEWMDELRRLSDY